MSVLSPALLENPGHETLADTDVSGLMVLLASHGAVLLRGYDIGLPDFEQFTCRLGSDFHVSATRMALRQAEGDRCTTEVFRDNFSLLGHTEGSYRPDPAPPQLCFFLCRIAPETGGETLLVDGEAWLACLPPALRQRLEQQGIIYEIQWPQERWQAEFDLMTEAELRAFLDGWPGVRYTLQAGHLHLFYPAAAITTGYFGQQVFATGLLAHLPAIHHPRYPEGELYAKPANRVYFGDGEPIPADVINTLIDSHDRLACYHAWQPNDLVVVDNTRVLHGRTRTDGPCERVIFSRFGRYRFPPGNTAFDHQALSSDTRG